MPQWVFEFGAPVVEPVKAAIERVIGGAPCSIDGMEVVEVHSSPLIGSLYERLRGGVIESLTLRPALPGVRYALVLPPEEHLNLWLGTVEFTADDFGWIWTRLLSTPGLTMVCLGDEEGVELTDRNLSVETFPWGNWPLVIGALRKADCPDEWHIRRGPQYPREMTI